MIFSEERIKEYILNKGTGVIFLDAPTRSGKTEIVQELNLSTLQSIILSGEKVYDTLIEYCKNNIDTLHAYDYLLDFKYVFIEDFDFYGGRPITEGVFANNFNSLSKHSLIVITGIDIRYKMPYMLRALNHYDYFIKNTKHWIKEN